MLTEKVLDSVSDVYMKGWVLYLSLLIEKRLDSVSDVYICRVGCYIWECC